MKSGIYKITYIGPIRHGFRPIGSVDRYEVFKVEDGIAYGRFLTGRKGEDTGSSTHINVEFWEWEKA